METITISKKEYQALKRAQRELERGVTKVGSRAPQRRGRTLSPQDFVLLKLAERSFDFWNNADDARMTDYNPGMWIPSRSRIQHRESAAVILSSTTFNHHHQMSSWVHHRMCLRNAEREYPLVTIEQREAGCQTVHRRGQNRHPDQRRSKQLGRMPEAGQQQLIHIAMTIFGAADRPDGDA
jgi:hypothetical protein